jgi:hypothetical protein
MPSDSSSSIFNAVALSTRILLELMRCLRSCLNGVYPGGILCRVTWSMSAAQVEWKVSPGKIGIV